MHSGRPTYFVQWPVIAPTLLVGLPRLANRPRATQSRPLFHRAIA